MEPIGFEVLDGGEEEVDVDNGEEDVLSNLINSFSGTVLDQEGSDCESDECNDVLEEQMFREHLRLKRRGLEEEEEDLDEEEFTEDPIVFTDVPRENTFGTNSAEEVLEYVEKAIGYNKEMRDMLLDWEHKLTLEYQSKLEEIAALKEKIATDPQVFQETRETEWKVPSLFYKQFMMPYFRDRCGFSCPANSDYRKKKMNNEPIMYDIKAFPWRGRDLKLLESAVKQCLVDEFKSQLEIQLTSRNSGPEKQLMDLIAFKKKVRTDSAKSLLEDDPDREFDWLKISSHTFDNLHSFSECRRMWHLYVKPSVNKEKWSSEEKKKFVQIVSKYNMQDWESIAKELNTSRSGYQCYLEHETTIRPRYKKGKWTKQEDERLRSVVHSCSYGSFISWTKVGYYHEERTVSQIYGRWYNCLAGNLKKGKFTANEDKMILRGVFELGLSSQYLARLIPNRSFAQIRERLESQLKPQLELKMGEWSIEEDQSLLRLVEKLGEKKWSEIAKELGSRSRVQVRHRYRLLKTKMKDPDFSLEALRRWNRGNFKKAAARNKRFVEKIKKLKAKNVKLPTNSKRISMDEFVKTSLGLKKEKKRKCKKTKKKQDGEANQGKDPSVSRKAKVIENLAVSRQADPNARRSGRLSDKAKRYMAKVSDTPSSSKKTAAPIDVPGPSGLCRPALRPQSPPTLSYCPDSDKK